MTLPEQTAAQRYVFDAAWQEERERLTALETIWDPYTRQNLSQLGIAEGWRCLEVGAGSGSVAAWMSRAVGPDGHVVATDLDTRFLDPMAGRNLEVRRHDIVRDDLEEGAFDLVHTRLLLEHLPEHDAALRKMVAALKPGGWLLLEEFDHVSFLPDPEADEADQAVWGAFIDSFSALAQERGLDLVYGRRLFSLLTREGLSDVQALGRTVMERGGNSERGLLLLSVRSLRAALVETGRIDDGQVERLLALLASPSFSWTSQIMVSARGRR